MFGNLRLGFGIYSIFLCLLANRFLGQPKESSPPKLRERTNLYTCTLYQDYLIIFDDENPRDKFKNSHLSIYNLKTQKMQSKPKDYSLIPVSNHCACLCEEKNQIIFYGNFDRDLSAGEALFVKKDEKHRIMHLNLLRNSDGFCSSFGVENF